MTIDKVINLCFISDQNYAMPTAVTITSLIHHKNTDTKYRIFIITDGFDDSTLQKYNELKQDNIEIIIKTVTSEDYIKSKITTLSHVSKTALLKFFIPIILKDCDRVLYLDSDLIIKTDLQELYGTNLDNAYLAAIFDYALARMPVRQTLLQIPEEKYFNTGVMLMDLQKLRMDNIPNKLIDYRLTYGDYFMDQESFNKILYNNVKLLPWTYNYYQLTYDKHRENEQRFYPDLPLNPQKGATLAKIIHFADKHKPWIYNIGAYSHIYRKYYKLSPYRNENLKLRSKKNIPLLKFIKYMFLENIF